MSLVVGLYTQGLKKEIPARMQRSVMLLPMLLMLLAAGISSCAQQSTMRYMYLGDETLDTEWGYPGSEARIEVSGRIAAIASSKIEKESGLLSTDVTLVNVSRDRVRILHRGCPIQILVFLDEKKNGKPVYDSFAGEAFECPVSQVQKTLFAQEETDLNILTHIPALQFDTPYYVTAIVRPNGIRMELPAGEVVKSQKAQS